MDMTAQTIVQLFSQLRGGGYGDDELRLIRRAYALLVKLATCQYRSSGRTLIDHAVGVASVLAGLDVSPALVAAGLVHIAYLHGDFGTWRKRVVESKRRRLRSAVGDAAEDHVHRYSQLEWTPASIRALSERIPALDQIGRDTVLMRLADQLDIYGSRDAGYCDNAVKRRIYARDLGPTVVAIATQLGRPALSTALADAFAAVADGALPIESAQSVWRDGALLPPSYCVRVPIALYQTARFRLYKMIGR
jgi:(p)ppGpp synthase/HD superfamily hydrolase